MADPRFYHNAGPFPVAELAAKLAAAMFGDGDLAIHDVADLDQAGPGELCLFAERSYAAAVGLSRAAVVLTTPELQSLTPPHIRTLVTPAARLAFAEAAWLFYPAIDEAMGFEDERGQASIGPGCRIASTATIGRNAEIGPGTQVGAGAVIGRGVVIGRDCVIGPSATVGFALIGDRTQILPGAVVGAQGFGFVPGMKGLLRVPQLGRVILGNEVEVGANTTIDRGALGDTTIGDGTKIDNQIQIGHNCRIGRYCTFSGRVGISGSVTMGDFVQVGGGVGVADHITIGAKARLAAGAGVIQDVAPGATVAGYPAIPIREWHRQTIGLRKLFSRSGGGA
jgi:UDP-3-O-[3-hydroxymyristoyl] glucosamine N-acyltransferase